MGVRISLTGVEFVVSDGAKTSPRQALKRSLRGFRCRSTPQDDKEKNSAGRKGEGSYIIYEKITVIARRRETPTRQKKWCHCEEA